jgi:transcription initiation factor TFIIH subunit 4
MNIVREHKGMLYLDDNFRKQFKSALTGGYASSERHVLIISGDTSSFGVPCETRDKNHVDIPFLDAYATKQWETILHFLVGTEMPEEPGGGVLHLLRQSGLMEGDPS